MTIERPIPESVVLHRACPPLRHFTERHSQLLGANSLKNRSAGVSIYLFFVDHLSTDGECTNISPRSLRRRAQGQPQGWPLLFLRSGR